MDWCEDNGIDFIFGLAGNAAVHGLTVERSGYALEYIMERRHFTGRGATGDGEKE